MDDVLLFSRGDIESIGHIMQCIHRFSIVSGLKPSANKSNVFFCNCAPEVFTWFGTNFWIRKRQLPVKFLGVISSKLSIDHCIPLIEKLTARVSSWTSTLLSLAGRVQLVKSVLFSMHSYWTNHFMLPAMVHTNTFSHCSLDLYGKVMLIKRVELG